MTKFRRMTDIEKDALMRVRKREGNPENFEQWMQKVNDGIGEMVGVSADDLPDVPYRDWFDGGMRPIVAARKAVRYSQGEE